MNWKQTLFWSFSAAAIFYYFLLFGVFVFVGHRGEVHADLKNLPRITRKGKRILSLLNLAQRLLGGAVQLEFHHVDIAIGL